MNIAVNTNELKPGDIFIPIKDGDYDGYHHIDAALAKGASQILDVDLDQYAKHYRKKLTCPVIAITGSAGKSTLKALLHHVLGIKYNVMSLNHSYLSHRIEVPLTLLKANAQTEIIIVEMGLHNKRDIHDLTHIVYPTHVVVSTIGWSHIDLFHTQRHLALAKAAIFKPLKKRSPLDRYAFMLYDMPYYSLLAQKAAAVHYTLLPYTSQTQASASINACYTIGQQFGLSKNDIALGLSQFKGLPKRLTVYHHNDVTILDDSYSASPESILYALEKLCQYSGRKMVVMGLPTALGRYTHRLHQDILTYIERYGISQLMIYNGLHQSITISCRVPHTQFLDPLQLIHYLKTMVRAGDRVLIKGPAHFQLNQVVKALLSC